MTPEQATAVLARIRELQAEQLPHLPSGLSPHVDGVVDAPRAGERGMPQGVAIWTSEGDEWVIWRNTHDEVVVQRRDVDGAWLGETRRAWLDMTRVWVGMPGTPPWVEALAEAIWPGGSWPGDPVPGPPRPATRRRSLRDTLGGGR